MLPERDAVASCLLSGLTVSTPACALVRRHDRPGAESMHEVLMLLVRKAQHLTSVNLTSTKQLLITVDIHNYITLALWIDEDVCKRRVNRRIYARPTHRMGAQPQEPS